MIVRASMTFVYAVKRIFCQVYGLLWQDSAFEQKLTIHRSSDLLWSLAHHGEEVGMRVHVRSFDWQISM